MFKFLLSLSTLALITLGMQEISGELKKTDCGDICSRVRCRQQKPEECDQATQVFRQRDGDCYCCDSCVSKAQEPVSTDKNCKPDHCATVKCQDVPSKVCFDKGLAFAPKDECSCCDSCV